MLFVKVDFSKELKKDVSYNFTVASGGCLAAPASALDSIAGLDELGDVADPVLASATQPSVGIKVLDKRHNAIYLWSLDRLQQQLQRMRNLTTFIDKPSYSQHFSAEEPFYESPPPVYSFIGNTLVSLAPLSRRFSTTCTAPIFCRYTSEAIGSCRIDIKIVSATPPTKHANGSAASTRSSSPLPNTLPAGTKVSFILTVDTIKGLSANDFSSVHMQCRLSSFVGPTLRSEEIYPSKAIDLDSASLSDLKLRRTFSIALTGKAALYLRTGYAPIEFFAQTRPTYLERLERWDEMRELRSIPRPITISSNGLNGNQPMQPQMRRPETEFVNEQIHDVVTWLQVRELAPDGQYQPVPIVSQDALDPGCFFLHQGLQRRLSLTLTSNSGRQLPWTAVTRVRIGNVRLLDGKGLIHDSTSKSLYDLSLINQQEPSFRPDGTGVLQVDVPWDSSVHDSTLLNRVTANYQRILLQLSWSVAVESCEEPVQFVMDMAVTMQTRNAQPPYRIFTFFGTSKIIPRTSTIFNVRLSPPLTRSAKDLWRLDTAEKYVRGEEALGTWKPRGVTAVQDYERLVETEQRAADVQAVKSIISNTPSRPTQADSAVWGADKLLQKTLSLWQNQLGHREKVCIDYSSVVPLLIIFLDNIVAGSS